MRLLTGHECVPPWCHRRQHVQKKVKPSKVEREVGQLKTMSDIETFLRRRNLAAYRELVDWKVMFNTARRGKKSFAACKEKDGWQYAQTVVAHEGNVRSKEFRILHRRFGALWQSITFQRLRSSAVTLSSMAL